MSSVLIRMRRIWRDHIAGPTLRSYDEACDELGGVPWRPAQDETDRWFLTTRPHTLLQQPPQLLQQPPPLPSFEKLPTLDTGAFKLKRSLSDGTKLWFLGGAALLGIALLVIVLAGGAHAAPQPAVVAPAAAALAPAATPPPPSPATAIAPAPARPRASLAVAARAAAAKKHLIARKRRR